MAPWGMQLEIVSAPKGTVADEAPIASAGLRLFHPGKLPETLI